MAEQRGKGWITEADCEAFIATLLFVCLEGRMHFSSLRASRCLVEVRDGDLLLSCEAGNDQAQ